MRTLLLTLGCALLATAPRADETQPQTLEVGPFGTVTVYLPPAAPRAVALFLSGDGGWNLGVVDMARSIAAQGSVVVGIDIRHYLAAIEKSRASCVSMAVDFENLSHTVQKRLALREYLAPVLVGYSSGATVVYATLAQAPPGTFAGAMSLGFCSDQDFGGVALCPGAGLRYTPNQRGDYVFEAAAHLRDPWVALQGQQDQVCKPQPVDAFAAHVAHGKVVSLPKVGHGFSVQKNWLPQFEAAFAELGTRTPSAAAPAPAVADLPLVEQPAAPAADARVAARFALLLTGDGGWAGLDQDIAARFVARGMPVVGFNTLRYFWSPRTPEQAAADVARALEHYLVSWRKEQVDLLGYSFGAEVLPFIVARLPAELRARVGSITLIAPSPTASFEIHVADWLPGADDSGLPVQPEIERLHSRLLCLYGKGDTESLCPSLPPALAVSAEIGTGHHLGGEADAIVERILKASAP